MRALLPAYEHCKEGYGIVNIAPLIALVYKGYGILQLGHPTIGMAVTTFNIHILKL